MRTKELKLKLGLCGIDIIASNTEPISAQSKPFVMYRHNKQYYIVGIKGNMDIFYSNQQQEVWNFIEENY